MCAYFHDASDFLRDYNWDWGSWCSHIFPHFKTNRDQESHRPTLVSIPCSRNYLQFKSSEQEQEHIDYLKVNIIRLDNHLQGAGRSLNEGAIKQEWVVVTSKHHPCNLTISPNLPGYNCSIWSKVSHWAFFECTTWQLGATLPYLIFVILFTLTYFESWKFFTRKVCRSTTNGAQSSNFRFFLEFFTLSQKFYTHGVTGVPDKKKS